MNRLITMHCHTFSFVLPIKILIIASALLFSSYTFAATMSVSPSTGVYTAGQTFTTRLIINTSGKSINAAEGRLSFKPTELSVVKVSKGSLFNLWTADPSFSNSAGTISFSGGSTPPGYSGSSGTVLLVTFRTKGAGNPKISFTKGAILAADGRGTNVLTSMNGAAFTVTASTIIPKPEQIKYIASANTPEAPIIISTTHADMSAWYSATTAKLIWDIPKEVIAVRTLLDTNDGSIPTKVYNTPIDSITLEDLEEGEQYFHLQFKNNEGWGNVSHYRIAVDSVKPTAFTIELPDDVDLSNPIQTLLLTPEDSTSPVIKFLVQVDTHEPYEFIDNNASGTLALSALKPGHHSVIIEAFDAAGNSLIATLSFDILAFSKPTFTDFPSELSEDVIPVIKGMTRPDSEVRILVEKSGSDTQEVIVQSSDTGEFVYIPKSRLTLGVYKLSAVAIDQYGAQSEMSDSIRIAVQQPGYLRIGTLAVNILSVVIPLIALVVLLIFGFIFLVTRLRKIRKGISRETEEALDILKNEFEGINTLIQKESKKLSSLRKTKKLTKAETALVENIKTALTVAQKKVHKEITDVEDILE